MTALTASQWKYRHFRKPTREALPTLIGEQKFYDENQVCPITAPMELANLRYRKLFLRGRDKTRMLRYKYGGPKCTAQFVPFNLSEHIRGKTCFGVYPGDYTHFINFDIDAHSPDQKENCIVKHAAIYQVLSEREMCRWQEVGPTGTHIWAVFSTKKSRQEAEGLCRTILHDAHQLRPDLDFDTVEYYPDGDTNCILPLRFDRTTILEKPIALETYTFREDERRRQPLRRFIDWLCDPQREYAEVDEDFLRDVLRSALPMRRNQQGKPPSRDIDVCGPQRGRFIENYIAFWTGVSNPPDSMQPWLGMSRRLLFAYGYGADEVNRILRTFVDELPDTSFSDQLTSKPRHFFRKLEKDTLKMRENQRQSDIEESNRIFANLVTKLKDVGFDPGNKQSWHTWDHCQNVTSTSRKCAFTWNHPPLAAFQGFCDPELDIIRAELLPIFGKRTSFEQAVVVTALLLDFVREHKGEIPVRRFRDIFKALPQVYLSSTIVINSQPYLLSLAVTCSLGNLNKVVALIDKLVALDWLRVAKKHWHKQGAQGRATTYALGSMIGHCWKLCTFSTPVYDSPEDWYCRAIVDEARRVE